MSGSEGPAVSTTQMPHTPSPTPTLGLLGAFTASYLGGPPGPAPAKLDRMPGHELKPREQKGPALGHMSVWGLGPRGAALTSRMGWEGSPGTGPWLESREQVGLEREAVRRSRMGF